MKTLKLFFVLALSPIIGFSQASLAAENNLDNVSVTLKNGKRKTYTLIRDAVQTKQWYFMPNELRLAEEMVNGVPKAKMNILRYQFQDKVTKEAKEGGVLVASFSMAIEPEANDQLKAYIQRVKNVSGIQLGPLQLKSTQISALSAFGEFVKEAEGKNTPGATSSSQEMVICMHLNDLGAGVMGGMLEGKGLPVIAQIKYNGLTPPCGYKVTGSWKNVYEYYEKVSKTEGKWGLDFGIASFGGGADKSASIIREKLNNDKYVKFEQIECEGDKNNQNLDQKIIDLQTKIETHVLGKEIGDQAQQVAQLQTLMATTQDPSLKKELEETIAKKKIELQFGYQQSLKDIKKTNSGSINFSNSKQEHQERESTFGSLLSLAPYIKGKITPDKLKAAGYLTDIDANVFPSVIFGLNPLNPDLGLRTVNITINYKNSDGKITSEARSWTADKGWTTPLGKEVGFIRFNMMGEKDKERLKNPNFEINMSVVSSIPNASFTLKDNISLANGESYANPIELLTDQVSIDGQLLSFKTVTQVPTDLALVKVEAKLGKIPLNINLQPFVVSGIPGPPNTLRVLVPKITEPITSKVTFFKSATDKVEQTGIIQVGDNTLLF